MSNSEPLALFTLFQKLPKELRIYIWNLTLTPSIITLLSTVPTNQQRTQYNDRLIPKNYQPPVALCINQESRNLILPRYLGSAFVTFSKSTPHTASNAIVRWNPLVDTVYLPEEPLSQALCSMGSNYVPHMRKVRRLAIPALKHKPGGEARASYQGLHLLRHFWGLQELVFVETEPTCALCIEGVWNCGQDAGCVGNPRISGGSMGRYTWEVLLAIDAVVAYVLLRGKWCEWKAPRILVVADRDGILESGTGEMVRAKRSPFSEATGFKLYERIQL